MWRGGVPASEKVMVLASRGWPLRDGAPANGALGRSRVAVVIASGRVLELHRWPVKSMGGQQVDAFEVDSRGVAGDRTHALFDRFRDAPRRLTARQAPGLLRWGAAYEGVNGFPPASPPWPTLTAPDGARSAWDDPALPAALAADLGREVALVRDLDGQQDLERSVLVTTRATHEAIERELGQALDPRRWRTNVLVELDAEAYAEEAWEGRRLTIGSAEFDLLHPCERCVIPTRDPDTAEKLPELLRWLFRERQGLFGMNARPLGSAIVTAGDRVSVS